MILKSGERLKPAWPSYFNFLRYILFDQVDRIHEAEKTFSGSHRRRRHT